MSEAVSILGIGPGGFLAIANIDFQSSFSSMHDLVSMRLLLKKCKNMRCNLMYWFSL